LRRKLSPGEQRLLDLLVREEGKISTNTLTRLFYDGRERPYNARQTVVGLVRSLCDKTLVDPSMRVRRTKRGGPHPIQVWVERREG
jgi:hypothetical protein